MSGIKKLHHNAYRCRDSEETRKFYEDFLGLPLAIAFELERTKTDRDVRCLHSFYELDDGSYLAFFEAPDMPFEFTERHDFDLHIALEIDRPHMLAMMEKAKAQDMDVRGISDHHFIESIYFRDPNGYVVELTVRKPNHDEAADRERNGARAKLDAWQVSKSIKTH